MWSRRTSAIIALIVGPIVGSVYPFIQVAYDCQAPESETCVSSKALLPVGLILSIVFIGALAAAAMFAILEWRRREREGNPE
jgi:hypothetical protein